MSGRPYVVMDLGGMVVGNLNAKQESELKDSLTFDNPAYASVKKFSKYGYTNVEPYLKYYEKLETGEYRVPIGANVPYGTLVTDKRITCDVRVLSFIPI